MNRRKFIFDAAKGLMVPFAGALVTRAARGNPFRDLMSAGVASAAWAPTSPSNTLVQWNKADALALSDGTAVSSWTATAGNAATQGTGGSQPLFKTAVKNGLPAIRFDGTDDFLATAAWGVEQTQPYTIALAYALRATTVLKNFVDGINGSKRCNISTTNSGGAAVEIYCGANEPHVGTLDTSWHTLLIEVNGASTLYTFDTASEATVSSTPGAQNLSGLTLGCAFDGTSGPCNVDIGEVIVWSGALSGGDKTSAVSYIGRWR